jgi:hypothetical protein
MSGYNLGNSRVRNLYNVVTGDQIEGQSFWPAFKRAAALRHRVDSIYVDSHVMLWERRRRASSVPYVPLVSMADDRNLRSGGLFSRLPFRMGRSWRVARAGLCADHKVYQLIRPSNRGGI